MAEMRGVGEGYFPLGDGLFRCYEVLDISDGWHAATEYTWDVTDVNTFIFRNATGMQDIACYRADHARWEAEKAAKSKERKSRKQQNRRHKR